MVKLLKIMLDIIKYISKRLLRLETIPHPIIAVFQATHSGATTGGTPFLTVTQTFTQRRYIEVYAIVSWTSGTEVRLKVDGVQVSDDNRVGSKECSSLTYAVELDEGSHTITVETSANGNVAQSTLCVLTYSRK